tara:strand:- start:2179 stop:2910 length:732 start_codon:yes stop_codon:yes gene_type:complete
MSKITILIPTYNRASLIAKTIENCFLQSCGDFTILIYDDGSTDNTTDVVNSIIKRYPNRIKYIKSKKNMGIGYSRKMLLGHLDSEFGVWLDSDDYMRADRLSKCVEYMNLYKDVDVVYSHLKRFHEETGIFTPMGNDITINIKKYDKTNYRSLHSNTACATAFFRKKLKDQEIIPLRYGSEDVLWLWQLLNLDIKVGQISEPLYFYRSHNDRISIEKKTLNKEAKIPEEIIIHEKIKEYRNNG